MSAITEQELTEARQIWGDALVAISTAFDEQGIEAVVHAFLDGRDTPPSSGLGSSGAGGGRSLPLALPSKGVACAARSCSSWSEGLFNPQSLRSLAMAFMDVVMPHSGLAPLAEKKPAFPNAGLLWLRDPVWWSCRTPSLGLIA